MRELIAIAVFTSLFAGCGPDRPPEGVLDVEKFAGAYAALIRSEQVTGRWTVYNIDRYRPDSTLAAAGVTRDQMIATMEYYQADVERWQEFYQTVIRILEETKTPQSLP